MSCGSSLSRSSAGCGGASHAIRLDERGRIEEIHELGDPSIPDREEVNDVRFESAG
jgi:hypothetical protein